MGGGMRRLIDLLEKRSNRMVIPLMGFPGIWLTKTSIKQNTFNWGIHSWTVYELFHKFHPDGIFFFMDLSVEASALGLPVRFPLEESPSVEYSLVRSRDDLQQFMSCDVLKDGRAIAFIETMRMMKRELPEDVVKGGYITGPFTLAGLMMGATEIATDTILNPSLVESVLEMATGVVTRYALKLEEAGADVIMMLDPTAVLLSPELYRRFAGRASKVVFSALKDAIPIIHICGDTTHLIGEMADTGAQALSLDYMVDIRRIASMVPGDVILMGNIDPVRVMRDGDADEVARRTEELLRSMEDVPNFILSTGCDLPIDTPHRNISTFIKVGGEFPQPKRRPEL